MSQKDIFLINNGLTCKDVYEKTIEYYRYKKRKEGLVLNKSELDVLKKSRRERKDKLSLNGIIEARELRKDNNMNNLKNNFRNNIFYCLCDRVSIETAMIYLNKESPYCTLTILPYIKYEKSITKASDITNFKNSFGTRSNNNMKNYWNVDSNIINSSKSLILDWTMVDNLEFSQIKNFSNGNLMNFILKQRDAKIPSYKFVLFCNYYIIKDFLKTVKDTKFKPTNKTKILNTQCINLKYNNNSAGNLFLEEYSTYYPQKLGNNTVSYRFEGKKYDLHFKYYSKKVLTTKLSIIPNSRCIEPTTLNKILNILNKGKKNNNKNKSSNNSTNNINNVNDFENIFKKLNKKKN